jgi:hypothetical protein
MNIPIEKVIDISELRIGNYLEYDGNIVHVTMLSLDIDDEYNEIIGFCEFGKYSNEHSEWNRALASKLDRIVLNVQTLEAAGFSIPEKGYLIWSDGKIDIHMYDDSGKFRLENYNGSRVEIKYLHQLQNIYHSLTGKELTIKL